MGVLAPALASFTLVLLAAEQSDQQEVSQTSFSSNPPVCRENVKESYILHGGRPFLLRVWPISIRDISCKLARNTALLDLKAFPWHTEEAPIEFFNPTFQSAALATLPFWQLIQGTDVLPSRLFA